MYLPELCFCAAVCFCGRKNNVTLVLDIFLM